MQVDIEVESELYCVLIVGANQLIESPAPYHIHLGHFEYLELSRSHPFPLDPQCSGYHLVVPTALTVNPSFE